MKTALITGASSGIGRELAFIHAQNGGELILVARRGDVLKQIKLEIEYLYKTKIYILEKDLTNPSECKEIIDFINDNNLKIEILINNAGIGDFGNYWELSRQREVSMIDLNITALTYFTKQIIPMMIENEKGYIMNIASIAAFMPGPQMAVYYATKSFVHSYSQALNFELKRFNISVTSFCPGPTDTDFFKNAGLKDVIIFSKFLSSSKAVAKDAYGTMFNKKLYNIHGFRYKILAFGIKFIPTNIVMYFVNKVQTIKTRAQK